MAKLSVENATYATLGVGFINVLMTIVSLVLVEKAGRKTLLLVGFLGMAIDTLLLTVSLTFAVIKSDYFCLTNSPIVIFCFQEENVAARCIAIISVLVFVIMFAAGPGSIPWFLVSELFNQAARPSATSLAVAVNWTANFMVGLGFLPLQVSTSHISQKTVTKQIFC